MVIYDCFDILQLFLNLFVFRQCPPFVPIVSAMPTFLCNFSATPSFLLKLISGYALFGDAHFSFEVISGYAFCSAMPIFFWSHFSAMPFVRLCPLFFWSRFRLCLFSAMPAIVFYICVFYFPPLYANRSNAIGGEGRFFYVFTACVPSFRQLYFLSVQRS